MHEIHLKTVDSTQKYAKEHSGNFPKGSLTCVIADEQTAGIGRFKRKWLSFEGMGLYVTFFFTLSLKSSFVSLAQLLALSFAKVLLKEGLKPEIKWPNDVRLNGKKISGVLCEVQKQAEHVDIFLGIGINVNLGEEELSQIDQPATSLFMETQKVWKREEILKKLQKQFSQDLEEYKKEGFSPFLKVFEELLAFKGETIRCFDGKKTWEGICHSLTKEGGLNLLLPDGQLHTVLSGDIH